MTFVKIEGYYQNGYVFLVEVRGALMIGIYLAGPLSELLYKNRSRLLFKILFGVALCLRYRIILVFF